MSLAADRTILKAFYQQYVAVLLILITSMIGLWSGGSVSQPQQSGVMPIETNTQVHRIGEFKTVKATLPGETGIVQDAQLEAVREVLLAHDLLAVVELEVPSIQKYSERKRITRALSAIRAYFVNAGVPTNALFTSVREQRGDTYALSVRFVSGGAL